MKRDIEFDDTPGMRKGPLNKCCGHMDCICVGKDHDEDDDDDDDDCFGDTFHHYSRVRG